MQFQRITVDPNKIGGVPRIRDLRLPVVTIVVIIAEGMTAKSCTSIPLLGKKISARPCLRPGAPGPRLSPSRIYRMDYEAEEEIRAAIFKLYWTLCPECDPEGHKR